MNYFCNVCDKTNKIYSKNQHLKNLTHDEHEKSLQIKHTIQNLVFFGIDSIFNDYITNREKISI